LCRPSRALNSNPKLPGAYAPGYRCAAPSALSATAHPSLFAKRLNLLKGANDGAGLFPYITLNAVTYWAPALSLTTKMPSLPGASMPTSMLALPFISVVTLAIGVHGVCGNRPHSAVENVWLGVEPLSVMWAMVLVTIAAPDPGALPVG